MLKDKQLTLYTTHCPKCKVLEKKLNEGGYEYIMCDNFDPEVLLNIGYDSVPVLMIDDTPYDFSAAVSLINEDVN